MSPHLPKTIILAIATLLLAVAALVTDLVSPYAGGIESAHPRMEVQMPERSPYRVPVRVDVQTLASKPDVSRPTFDAI